MIPGWSMNSNIWGRAITLLQAQLNLYCVDLPGLGKANAVKWPENPWEIVTQISTQVPQNSIWLGWSMGGLLAQKAALTDIVSKLILVASSPCMVTNSDWPLGIEADLFQQFFDALKKDHIATLNRFLALEVQGSRHAARHLKWMRTMTFSDGEPSKATLLGGMKLLANSNFSQQLDRFTQDILLVGGQNDRLIPWEAIEYTATHLPTSELVNIPGAGHAPFISNPELFTSHILDFCCG